MVTKKKRIAISLTDKDFDKLTKIATKNHVTKSAVLTHLLTQIDQPKVDQETLKNVLDQLQKLNNNLSRAGNNLNQYQHQINHAMNSGYFDKDTAFELQTSWSMTTQAKWQDDINKALRGLSRYVDY